MLYLSSPWPQCQYLTILNVESTDKSIVHFLHRPSQVRTTFVEVEETSQEIHATSVVKKASSIQFRAVSCQSKENCSFINYIRVDQGCRWYSSDSPSHA